MDHIQIATRPLLTGDDWVLDVVFTDDTVERVYCSPSATEERAIQLALFRASSKPHNKGKQVKEVTTARRHAVDPHFRRASG